MHIVFLTDNFPPEVNAPASRTYEHCREWVKLGHRITVITCVPNFPIGKVFEGYRNRLWQREIMDGINVVRVWTYIAANEGVVRRTVDYFSFMGMALFALVFVRNIDIIVATSPQIFTACAGYIGSRLKRRPYVFELRDLWPESIRVVGAMQDSTILRWLERLELFLYRKASVIVSVTHSFRSNLTTRGIDASKIEVVTNGVDLSRFSPRPKDKALARVLGIEGMFVAGYVGTHGMAHALDTILSAAARLRDTSEGRKICFVLLGDGAEKMRLKEKAAALGLNSVIFLNSVPKGEIVRYWSLLDVAIIHLKKENLFSAVIPSKLFECMAMGIPVLHGVPGESADIVVQDGAGLLFEPENDLELANAIVRMAQDREALARFGSRASVAAAQYDRTALARRMLETLQRAAISDGIRRAG